MRSLPLAACRCHRWLSSCTAVCPRLLALPRHQLFRLFRDWAAGRVASGDAAGATNERVAYMFRGVGEIVWKEVGWSRIKTGRVCRGNIENESPSSHAQDYIVERQGCFSLIEGSWTKSRRDMAWVNLQGLDMIAVLPLADLTFPALLCATTRSLAPRAQPSGLTWPLQACAPPAPASK